MLAQSIELSGTLAADETSEVASLVAGQVLKVNVDVGTKVKKGEALVELDRRDAALRAAQASAQQAQANARLGGALSGGQFNADKVPEVAASKEAYDLAKADADRTKALFDSGAVSAAAWDQARSRLEQTRAQYDSAVSGARAAQASLTGASAATGLASKAVADSLIRAPFDGSVAERRISIGEYVTPGKVVAVVVSDNPMRLRIDVAEADLGKIQIGSPVQVAVVAFPNRSFEGAIKRIGASIRAQSRALPIEAEIPNEDGALRSGMFARAIVNVPGQPTKAILVPATAIGTTGAASRVFVKSSDKVIERLVMTGRRSGTLVEVVGEIKEGEEVAVSDLDKLSDGATVAAR
ncbi:MAG: efflux RND transporter periplasmic adaptor subunit [Myxococcales bacterium]|nr:MAG: efflux RND transporter periplasmic adaptor subunit [Myxococcales bacterium]